MDERVRFREMAEAELLNLHEGNFARYRIRPSEFADWQVVWQTRSWGKRDSTPDAQVSKAGLAGFAVLSGIPIFVASLRDVLTGSREVSGDAWVGHANLNSAGFLECAPDNRI